MQDWYDLPKDSTAYPTCRQQYVYYWQTSEFRRWFAKWIGSAYILMGILLPLVWFLLYGFNIFDVLAVFIIEIIILYEIIYITIVCFDEIIIFLKNKLEIGCNHGN